MNSWDEFLANEKKQPYLADTLAFIKARRAQGVEIYPPDEEILSAFIKPNFEDINVVILGQDPYHGANQAHGLCFSVKPGIKPPPSLANIFKELATDIEGFNIPEHGYLQAWAEQGVFLLNTVLSVEAGLAHSHKHLGWESFTDRVIKALNDQRQGIIFMLWGSHAQKKGKAIDTQKHTVLKAPHPSPLSAHRGFFGCKHFSMANQQLIAQGQTPINWQL